MSKLKSKILYKKSVAFRLAIKFSILVAVLILFVSSVFIFLLNQNVRQQQSAQIISCITLVQKKLEFRIPPAPPRSDRNPPSSNRKQMEDMPPEENIYNIPPFTEGEIPYYITFSVFSIDDSNKIVFSNDPFLPFLDSTNSKVRHYYKKDFYTDGDLNILYSTKDLNVERFGNVRILVSMNMDQDFGNQFFKGAIPLSVISFIPLVLLSFAVVYFITKKTMKPVLKLTEAAKKITTENLSQTLPVSGRNDEIDNLSKTFNDLFARLNNDFLREKQFTSDVSHELKTPLAVILGHANLIQRWGKDDPVQLQKSLGFLIDEVHSMEAIVENLLQISRLDNRRIKVNKNKVELLQLFHRLEQDTKVWAPKTTFNIEETASKYTLLTDEELFYQACTIVVSNSVKYFVDANDELLTINISVQKNSDKSISVYIKDNGPGISEEVLPHVFERFYRGDASHKRTSGGLGLGLSIVQSIMKNLDGSVKAQSDGRTGTTLVLTI